MSRKKNNSPEIWGIAVAAMLASAGLGYLAFKFFFSKPKITSKKKKVLGERLSGQAVIIQPKESIPPKNSHSNVLSEEQIQKIIDSSFSKLKSLSAHGQTGGTFSKEDQNFIIALEKIARTIRTMADNLDKYSAPLKLRAAQWLNLYNVQRTLMDPESNNLKYLQSEDLKLALKLLDFDDVNLIHSQEDYENYLSVKLEFAQNMNDFVKVAHYFDKMQQLKISNYQVLMLAFTSAATLGRWTEFMNYAENLLQINPEALSDIHAIAQRNPAFPDFQALYELLQDLKSQNDIRLSLVMNPKDIKKQVLQFSDLNISLKDVTGTDHSTAKKMKKELKRNWKPPTITEKNNLICNGTLVHCIGFSVIPISMVGIYTGDSLILRGFFEQSTGNNSATQIEELRLSLETGSRKDWDGSLAMKQVYVTVDKEKTEASSLTIEFDMKAEIENQ
jgi:hypothetical protein